ncbi:hypothetical protein GWI33_010684, partial [Rhynchophorus ferrugineus]
ACFGLKLLALAVIVPRECECDFTYNLALHSQVNKQCYVQYKDISLYLVGNMLGLQEEKSDINRFREISQI